MKEIRICWLCNELLDLYGDSGNISAITYQLDYNHIPYVVEHKGIYDDIDFDAYDFFYIGPGKDRNIIETAKHFSKYKDAINKAINDGKVFLITGNAQLLFGKSFKDDQNTYEGLGIFDYSGTMTGKVFINDYVCRCGLFDEKVYGFINRTSTIDANKEESLFNVLYSQNDIGGHEGIHRNNCFSTWALGPVLVKNPYFLRTMLSILVKDVELSFDDELMIKAYNETMKEFNV